MAIREIPNSGYTYRIQPLDKDQASQQDQFKREKKKKSDEQAQKGESTERITSANSGGRINLIV
ncbi:MAG TPA: hypothetical protein VJ417_09025 [Candidatus Glassbacteria bacterium]|nr:hypothetical protein [Candidatus Glassbacteria bacterium]